MTFSLLLGAFYALNFGIGSAYPSEGNSYSRNRKITQSTPGSVVRARISRRKLYASALSDWSVVIEVGAEADFLYAGTREVWPGPRWLGGLGVFVGVRW